MKRILRAEMWDKMQYLFRNYYDRMMHCVLYYDGHIDEEKFKRALAFQVDSAPVLHSRYHNNFFKPYWVVQPYKIDDVFSAADTDDLEGSVMRFAEQRIPIDSNAQIRVCLLYTSDAADEL